MTKTYKVFWSEAAEDDLRSIIEYIYSDSPPAARESLKKIQSKASSLSLFPKRGRILPELEEQGILQYRELVIPLWRVIYRISEGRVYVLSVIDSRRNVEDILFEKLIRKK